MSAWFYELMELRTQPGSGTDKRQKPEESVFDGHGEAVADGRSAQVLAVKGREKVAGV